MSEERYEPVSCDYHDELEAAAMHRNRVALEFDLDGVARHGNGEIADVYTANGAEWVRFVTDDGGPVEIRLDHIISFREE
jgi:transcriptional antiterminator Rof (Rho-off)